MSIDHLNSQPLGFGVGAFQTSFGLGSDGDEDISPPFVFIPEEALEAGPVLTVARFREAPRIGGKIKKKD